MYVFQGESANQVWKMAVAALQSADRPAHRSRAGATREILMGTFVLEDPRQRWVVEREPALSVAFAIVEVIGLINGRRDSHYLNYFNPALPRFAGDTSEYHGAYGHRLRSNFGFDQIHRAFLTLQSNPESRQVVLEMWDAAIDFPSSNGTPAAPDIPCNICSLLKIRNGRLYWTQLARSNDLFRGVPYNFVQFTSLQEIIAGWLGCQLGSYTHISDSLHLYDDTLEHAYSSADLVVPRNLDLLSLRKPEADLCWGELNRRLEEFIDANVTETKLDSLARMNGFPESISNLSRIVGADSARRHGYYGLAVELGNACSSEVLRLLWHRWLERKDAAMKSRV
jgi:thymidylate synthase